MRTYFIVLLMLLTAGCSEPQPEKTTVIRPIAWTQVSMSSLEQVRTLSGIIAPVETASLSFEVNGKTESVSVNLGDTVTKGQQLAKLNQRSFNLGLQSAMATLKQMQAAYSEAKNEYQRYTKLSEQGLVSKSGFDNAKAGFESSKSAVDVAQAQVDIARKNIQDSTLSAPYDGVITKRTIEPSQQVSAGQTLFEIEGTHGLEVQLMVPETLIRELNQDTQLTVTFPVLPQLQLTGHITEIGTRAQTANAFPLTAILDQSNEALRAGMTAEVEFTFEGRGRTGFQGPSIKVPINALGADVGQKSFVFVYNPQSQQVNKRYVQTENVLGNHVYLSSGLKNGEIIAVAGVAFLRDGQQVTLLDKHTQRFN